MRVVHNAVPLAIQNCTDHAVMLFTHPDRAQKPPRPRTVRVDRRDPARAAGGSSSGSIAGGIGGGLSPWGTAASSQGFLVGGNAFFPGSSSAHGGGLGKGDSGRLSGGSSGGVGPGAGVEGDVTLVEPGKVCFFPYSIIQCQR